MSDVVTISKFVLDDLLAAKVELGCLKKELENLKQRMRKIKCLSLVRESIERYENQSAPNYTPPNSKVATFFNYHEEKWNFIIENNGSLKNLLEKKNIKWDFATIESNLLAVLSNGIHFLPLVENVSTAEIIQVFQDEFRVNAAQKVCLEIILQGLPNKYSY